MFLNIALNLVPDCAQMNSQSGILNDTLPKEVEIVQLAYSADYIPFGTNRECNYILTWDFV